ncbi:MAG: GntR family transcriptional regulator, partial [Fusobacteriaceae bacterium]
MIIEKRKSIREQVYETLRDLIINGEIEAGERVVEVEYAEKFHVSRTPVREAIRMLELEGLVEVNSKGGVLVKEVTPEDIKEIYKIRIALEGVIIEEI